MASQKGFTLIELLIVLAVLAILAAVVVPNVSGFLNRGKDTAYKADQRTMQAAVDAWRSDVTSRSGNQYPILDSDKTNIGTPSGSRNSYVDVAALYTSGYFRGADVVASANTSLNTSATNSPSGTYGWYVSVTGTVMTSPTFSSGTYP
ncbi:MAG: prepilin-type N-terminal cleavage/methylation domain-containing protein [Chloroflexi bacterium]|nr:prepilin-type N-terminal cleavage/methylation domain-containing protein [Chloroflexota bacterium]